MSGHQRRQRLERRPRTRRSSGLGCVIEPDATQVAAKIHEIGVGSTIPDPSRHPANVPSSVISAEECAHVVGHVFRQRPRRTMIVARLDGMFGQRDSGTGDVGVIDGREQVRDHVEPRMLLDVGSTTIHGLIAVSVWTIISSLARE